MRFLPFLLLPVLAFAKETPVADAAALEAAVKSVQPGDVLVMAEGEWRDVEIVLTGQGTAQAPITLRAAVPGKTILTGKSILRIGGEHLAVAGLHFKNPDPALSDLIQFRKDSNSNSLSR